MLWVCSCEIYLHIFPKVLSEVLSLRPNLVNQWVSWSFLQECCIVESPCKQGDSSWLEPWSSAQLISKSAGWKVFSSVSLSTMSPWRGGLGNLVPETSKLFIFWVLKPPSRMECFQFNICPSLFLCSWEVGSCGQQFFDSLSARLLLGFVHCWALSKDWRSEPHPPRHFSYEMTSLSDFNSLYWSSVLVRVL